MKEGFLRVAAAVPSVCPADIEYNMQSITAIIDELARKNVEIVVFPEMCITGYTCADLFHNKELLDRADAAVEQLANHSKGMNITIIVGVPVRSNNSLKNAAAIINNGTVNYVQKTYIPNYNEFYERRWWSGADSTDLVVYNSHGVTFAVEICEDLWVPVPPSSRLSLAGAEVIFNLSASDDTIGKYNYLRSLVANQSARCIAGYVYSSAGYGESSTDLVFSGKAIVAENGHILSEKDPWDRSKRYVISDIDIDAIRNDRMTMTTFHDCSRNNGCTNSEIIAINTAGLNNKADNETVDPVEFRDITPTPFVPSDKNEHLLDERCTEITHIQASGLMRRIDFIKSRNVVLGISGGLDSTLALLVAVKAFDELGWDRKGIIGVTMPGFGTTDRTHSNAVDLMHQLGITVREIPIAKAVNQHFEDIGHDPGIHDVTYENSQARERTQILMDIANQCGGIVIGTGDLSELALGWATYNGDHMSMYGVNTGVPKTLVRHLVKWHAKTSDDDAVRKTLLDIVDTPVSPELLPASDSGEILQKTESLVGPYELHDFFLYYTLRYGYRPRKILLLAMSAFENKYDRSAILKWMKVFFKRFFSQQFKRSCMPDGPKVGSVCLSPRGDWRMPSDASSALWIKEIEKLEAL